MPGYEKAGWGPGGYGTELVPFVDWEIGMLMTRHHDECRIREELRRSSHTGERNQGRRLELAQATACTCGAHLSIDNAAPIESTVSDIRDNRDPAEVGRAHLNR